MTINEISSRSNQLQIYFWDAVIWFMLKLQNIRNRLPIMVKNDHSPSNLIKIIITCLIWLAVGLYLGIILGYLNI
jgi:hypothetical protein